MKIIYSLDELQHPLENPVLTIGNFDGVHKGHLALFDKVKERARAIHGQSAVMTFDPHPIKVMKPGNGPPLITTTQRKLKLIAGAGVDVIFCLPFTREFAEMSAESFIRDVLLDKLGLKEIVVGYDYSFGKHREGNIDLLRKLGETLGYKVHEVKPVLIDETLVSSTSIRNLISGGDIEAAKTLLGRDYQISGTVVKGQNRGGRLLGFPTANLMLEDELIPKRGIYAVTVGLDDKTFWGVTNIGYNPTFGNDTLTIETHILDFSGDLVGKAIKITFLHRLRDEKTFNSVEELSEQIALDIQHAKDLLGIAKTARHVG